MSEKASDPTNSSPGRSELPISIQACIPCRNKHKRCDGGRPCQKCTRINKASDCVYAAPRKRGPRPANETFYEYCENLKTELEMQKQIAEHWKEQFKALEARQQDASSSSSSSNSSDSTFPTEQQPNPLTGSFDENISNSYVEMQRFRGEPILDFSLEKATLFARAALMDPLLYLFEFDIPMPSPKMMLELWVMSPLSIHHLRNVDPSYLVTFFAQAVYGLLGSCNSSYPEYAHQFTQKSEMLCTILSSHDQSLMAMQPELVQPIATATVLLWSYLFNEDHEQQKKHLILLVYDLISQYNHHISPGLMLRTHLSRLCISQSIEDAKYWYSEVMFVAGLYVRLLSEPHSIFAQAIISPLHKLLSGGEPLLTIRSVVEVNYALCVIRHAVNDGNIPMEEILETEDRLAAWEHIIEQGVVVAMQFPHIARILEEAMMTVRLSAIAVRARLLTLAGHFPAAARLIEAVCILVKMMIPSLSIYIHGLNAALEATAAMKNGLLLRKLTESLCMIVPAAFPGLERLISKAYLYIQEIDPEGPPVEPPASRSPVPRQEPDVMQKFMIASQIRSLALPSQNTSAFSMTPAMLGAELARAAEFIGRYADAHVRMHAYLNQEITNVHNPL